MLFVRFFKRCGDATKDLNKSKSYRSYRRAVCVGNTYLVQDGDKIVAYAYFDGDKFNILVVDCENTQDYVRYTKRFIGNSATWTGRQYKKRKYNVVITDKPANSKFKIIMD